jgi:hypothetical protein
VAKSKKQIKRRQVAKSKKRIGRRSGAKKSDTGNGIIINAWEDDPGSGVLTTRPVPDLTKKPLAFSFPKPAPQPEQYHPGTPQFRYWTAAEALRRGGDFWAGRVPLTKWEVGPTLKIILDEGVDLNAFYDRKALNFFHGPSPGGTVFSGESPDIVCHEMGHAILDSFKPELWGAASDEVAAFHESFADISAILSAIQLPSLRTAVLVETSGHFYSNSRLSRLAEQLGAAIRAQQPDAVDPDCLRNAVNSFLYNDPNDLPPSAPASQLSSEPHSFSRVFTGAFYEALGGLLAIVASDPSRPTEEELLSTANDLAGILVTAIKQAPVVANWYAQVAGGMVQVAGAVNKHYPTVLKGVLVRRSILSLQSATSVQSLRKSMVGVAAAQDWSAQPLAKVAIPASHYGLDQPLIVETASQARPFLATSAAPDASQIDPVNAVIAAQAFVDDLFSRGRVDYAGVGRPEARIEHGRGLCSHRLVKRANSIHLERTLFDCGLCSH